jgi:hypothetical protein
VEGDAVTTPEREPDPALDPIVEGVRPPSLASMLDAVEAFVRRYVVLSDPQSAVVTLWLAHVFAFEAASTTLYLHVSSATPRAGKTRLLEVIEAILGEDRSLSTVNVSSAALYRTIDARPGTALLIDEADRLFGGPQERVQELFGLINSGTRRRGGKAMRVEGRGTDMHPKSYRTFSPKLIAGIGTLPDTIADRSAAIRMRRRLRSEPIERFREDDALAAAPFGAWFEHWADATTIETLAAARPDVPDKLDDRAQDAWEPLLTIADTAGEEWPSRARRAAVALAVEAETVAEERLELLCLRHVRHAFDEHGEAELPSATILAALVARDDGPWAEWWADDVRNGKGLVPARRLAKLLAPFDVHPTVIRSGSSTPRGYVRGDFEDAWARNLGADAVPTATTTTTATPLASAVADVAVVVDVAGSLTTNEEKGRLRLAIETLGASPGEEER